jgi:hypothetical protein
MVPFRRVSRHYGVDLFIVRLLPAAACLWQEAGTAVLESEDERRH